MIIQVVMCPKFVSLLWIVTIIIGSCDAFTITNNNNNNQYHNRFGRLLFTKTNSQRTRIRQQQQHQQQRVPLLLLQATTGNNNLGGSSSNSNKDDTSLVLKAATIALPIPPSTTDSDIPTTTTSAAAPWDNISFRSSSERADPKVGVLLLNLGGPETGDDVEGFLYNLFADPDIIRLPGPLAPLQKFIAYFISKRRAPQSRAAYESIGGGSPILKYSKEQAALLQQSIAERYGLQIRTYIGMRYWYPFTEEALEQIRNDHIEALVIVPLYPQFSISTSGSSLRILQEEFSKNNDLYKGMVHTVVPSWYARPGYIKAMTDLIEQQLESYTDNEIREGLVSNPNQKPLHILFSAHGVPQSYIDVGDPYQQQIVECVDLIKKELMQRRNYKNDVEIHLSYQSRVGPIEWLRPYTDDVLPSLGQSGVKNLVVVPISFVSEHVETLEEIDLEYRELAEENGVTNWRRVPALNTDPTFIDDLADLVIEALEEPAQSVTEACVSNSVGDVELQPIDERLGIGSAGIQGVGGTGVLAIGSSSAVAKEEAQQETERWTGRFALFTIGLILLIELFSGQSFVSLLAMFTSNSS